MMQVLLILKPTVLKPLVMAALVPAAYSMRSAVEVAAARTAGVLCCIDGRARCTAARAARRRSPVMTEPVTPQFLARFAAAWNRHDCHALLSMCTDDCVFETAAGAHAHGDRHAGHAALRVAFSRVWEIFPDARWEEDTHVVCGDRGFSEWTFRGTDRSGNVVEVRGVDLFTFRDGRIAKKDTFRKTRSS